MTSTPAAPAPDPDPDLHLLARCPEDLLAAAPVVLGFHPADSVVMLTGGGHPPFHGRSPLPPPFDPGGRAAVEVAQKLLEPARFHGVRSAAFVFYSDEPRAVSGLWRLLRRGCDQSRIRLLGALRADGQRYFPLLGDKRMREVGVAYDVSGHRFIAQAVMRGIVIEKDRDALAASVRPDAAAQVAVANVLDAAGLSEDGGPTTDAVRRQWGEWLQELVMRHLADESRPTDEEVARAVWAMQDVRVRDAAWALMRRSGAREHQEFWRSVVRRTPDPLVPAPAALFGWASWLAGNGALAWVAVDRCQEVRPTYGMAMLLADALDRAIPPELGEPALDWDEGLPR